MQLSNLFTKEKQSMHRKLFTYMLTQVIILLLMFTCFLVLFGRFETTNHTLSKVLTLQADVFTREMNVYYNEIAENSITLSEDISLATENYLAQNNMSFSSLINQAAHIEALEQNYADILLRELSKIDCSGAYLIMNTSQMTKNENNRAGLYIKQDLLAADKNDSYLLFCGSAKLGEKDGIILHRKWQSEFDTSLFPNYSEVISSGAAAPDKACYILDMTTLPQTSEKVMLVSIPIIGSDGSVYGICGFEINQALFKSKHSQPTFFEHLTCLFSRKSGDVININEGLSCGVDGGYYLPPKESLNTKSLGSELVQLDNAYGSYVGIINDVSIYYANSDYAVTVMIPKSDYTAMRLQNTLKALAIIGLLLLSVVFCCFYFSRRYISPILVALDKIKKSQTDEKNNLLEIDDLFDFLSRKDREQEAALNIFMKKNEKMQSEIERINLENEKLATASRNVIQQDDYEYFVTGIQRLTATEKNVFNLYLDGKSAAEIMETMSIKQSTLKYHNKNIYDKLGVSGKKQLLHYAALYNARTKEK